AMSTSFALMQNPLPAGNPATQNPAENSTTVQNIPLAENPAPTPEGDLISFDENPPTHQPTQPREASAPAVDLLTDLTIDELIKRLSKPEIDNEKDSEPSDSEYDTAEEEPDIHFEKIKDPYINRIAEAGKFNEGEVLVCDYYAFVPKGYYAENKPLGFFESIEEKIANVYKRELALKGGLKHETIEIIREDRIGAVIEKGYNEIIDQIENEALQESGWTFVRAEEVFLEISAFRPLRVHHAREDALKAGQKPTHLERNEVFGKIKVDIDPLRISERNYQVEHMIDLTEGEENLNDRKNKNDVPEGLKTHYVFITNFTRLMRPSKAPQRLILPEEGKNYVKPKYIKNMLMKPYIINMDLEAEEVEVEGKYKEGNTIKLAEHKAVSYGYTIHCSDGTTQKPVINRTSENIIKDLIENLQEDLDVILDKLRIPVPCEKMTPELWRKYQMANKCWNCEDKLHDNEAGYNKICVFDPETKKYLGASHRKCYRK
ncbi:1289_t:CDS:2, partial [Paraglomus occultum]